MSNRNCTEFEDRLHAAVEARAPLPSPDLRAAAAHCPDCRAAWERHVLLDRAIAAWTRTTPAIDLSDAVLGRFAFEESAAVESAAVAGGVRRGLGARPSRPQRAGEVPALRRTSPTSGHHPAPRSARGGWSAVAVAAAVLLLALLAFGPSRRDTVDERHAPPLARTDRPAPDETPLPPDELDVLVRDAGSACLVLADEATVAVAFLDGLLPRRDKAPSTPSATIETPPSWAEDLGRDLQPIRRDVGRAVGFLWDAVSLDAVETI